MALKIDQQTEDALTFRIAEGLGGVKHIFYGFYLSDFKWAEEVAATLPETLADRLAKICGENGLAEFIYGQVELKTDEDETLQFENIDVLTDISAYKDTISASKHLVEELRELPYSYRMSVPLPASFSDQFFDLCQNADLGVGISIISGEKLASDYPVTTGFVRRDERIQSVTGKSALAAPDPAILYLVQNRSGYIGRQNEPPITADFKNTLRQFLGAALAVKALKKAPWNHVGDRSSYAAHRRDGETQLIYGESLPPSLRGFYTEMGVLKSDLQKEKVLKNDTDARKRKIEAIKSVFALNDHGRRLSIAAIWYLRSHMSGDTLDALLESTISLEALLGGGNNEGTKLSSLLGNRCAYLIGKSIIDRQEILSNFNEIYTLRSKIVHEGHHRFSSKERSLLTYSRELCRRALVKEMIFSS